MVKNSKYSNIINTKAIAGKIFNKTKKSYFLIFKTYNWRLKIKVTNIKIQ